MIRALIALGCLLFAVPAFSYDEEAKEEFFLSTPEQVATLSSEPSYLIGGLISPLSGSPTLRQTDFIVKGAQELVLSRTYMSPHMPVQLGSEKQCPEEWEKYHLYQHVARCYKGWQFYPHLKLQFIPSKKQVLITEPSGSTLSFVFTGSGMSDAEFEGGLYGISNCAGETPSGANDPRNTRITYGENGQIITVYGTDKGTRIYRFNGWDTNTAQLYLLEKEILPNGKVLKYHYEGRHLTSVESLDPKERFVYASIRIKGNPWNGNVHFLSSSGQTADYEYERRAFGVDIEEVTKKHWIGKDDTREIKCNLLCPPILTKVSSPNFRKEHISHCGRFLLESYEGKDQNFQIVNRGYGEELKHYRAYHLSLPVSENDAFTPVYEMSYQPPVAGERGGKTTVKNSDGTSIIYHFSKNLLITAIQYFGEDGKLKKEKIFTWDDNNFLKTVAMRDSQKNLLYKKSFKYDKFGNPILEIFSGDLTGEGNQETFTTRRTFSDDGRNLLLREENEEGKATCFSYLPHTNLLTSKFTKDGDKIILREFSIYDDCHNLIRHIADDGITKNKDDLSGTTQRRVTTYILRQAAPFLHMPEWIVETYLESGVEKPLKKTHLVYDEHGNVAEEEIFDAEENYAYTICKTYNERGDVLTETNRLGQEASYTYDARGRPETATSFSGRIHKTFQHDTKGRLCKIKSQGEDGAAHVVTSNYDFHDRRVSRQDPFQNSTQYTYDPLVNEVVKTDFPSIASVDGQPVAVTSYSTYDPFGRELTKTDPNGDVTTYRYNAYGSPTQILHPNGGREHFRYTPNGKLISYTNPDGLTIRYKNDVLGRVLQKTYISTDGEILAEETYTYNGFNLLAETDKEGNVKQYSYDGAGRKIREDFCGRITEFAYDPLGRLAVVCKYNGGDALVTHYERDLEGRILEEKKTDLSGHILYKIHYSYDADGNRETVTRYINEEEATQTFAYDSFSRLIEYRDAEGYVTRTAYDENYLTPLGQRALQIATTDPRGIITIETQDALTRTAKIETLNSHGTTTSCLEKIHDPQGNLIYQKDHVYESDRFQSTQIVKYTYTPDHQIKSFTKAFGTKDARTTTYTYFPSGKMATKTHPDGVILNYSYHPLGFMSRLDSSDGKIQHTFKYDRLGHLKAAIDENQNIVIRREVDPFGNVTSETFPHGFEIVKNYDGFNRVTFLEIADCGKVFYQYDPLFLREVERTSRGGGTLYTHTYDEYDLDGNLVSESLMKGLGRIEHSTEARGQKACISSPYFSQVCNYDSVGNLITNIVDNTEYQYSYDDTSQLSSESSLQSSIGYTHDSLYNRVKKNGNAHEVNDLNELLSGEGTYCSYDLNGNQILKKNSSETSHFNYDPLNQLVEITSEEQKIYFAYDPLGRRLSKTSSDSSGTTREYYLYDGYEEIGAFHTPSSFKNLRVLGKHQVTVGIEIGGKIYAPIIDVQGNTCRLVDPGTKTLTDSYDFTAFGEELPTSQEDSLNPWRFASKRFDPELGLIYFGKRYYDPGFGRWITTDPAGFVDSYNLYQYVLNNPFRYQDPNGESVGGYLLGLGEIALGGAIMITGGVIEIGSFGTLTIGFAFAETVGASLIMNGLATTTYHAKDISFSKYYRSNSSWENSNAETVNSNQYSSGSPEDPDSKKGERKIGRRKNFQPDPNAQGSHTVYKRDPQTGKVTKYETYQPQTNPYNKKPWESVTRYDGPGSDPHWNKFLEKYINPPHVHDPRCPGGIRPAMPWEMPK